jgi:hypothetical protein
MSWKATAYVKELREGPNGQVLTRTEKLVMFVLADCFNPDYYCAWPSVERLARASLLTDRHVRRILRSLEAKGVIQTTENRGSGHTNAYRFPGFTSDVTSSKSGTMSGLSNGKTGQGEFRNRTSHPAKSDTAKSGKPQKTEPGTAKPTETFLKRELESLKLKNSVGEFTRRNWRVLLDDPAQATSLPDWFRREAEECVRE